MVTNLYAAEIKLNKHYEDYKKYLVAINGNGILIMDKGLFVVSFFSEEEFKQGVEIKDNNLSHIGDITL